MIKYLQNERENGCATYQKLSEKQQKMIFMQRKIVRDMHIIKRNLH